MAHIKSWESKGTFSTPPPQWWLFQNPLNKGTPGYFLEFKRGIGRILTLDYHDKMLSCFTPTIGRT